MRLALSNRKLEMALFRKVIARPGTYLARGLDGKRLAKTLTAQELAEVCRTGNDMLAKGHLIPAPYGHTDKDGLYPVPLYAGSDGAAESPRWDHAVNAGFWKSFETNAEGALVGVLETDEEHAKRIGNEYRQTSALLASSWTDGRGETFRNAPLHVCVTNKAVEPDQENFALLPSQKETLAEVAMAFSQDGYLGKLEEDQDSFVAMSEDSEVGEVGGLALAPELVGKVKQELKTKLDLTLPEDTSPENFFDRFLTILLNLKPKEEGDDVLTEPSGTETLQSPTIMSHDPVATPDPKTDALLKSLTESRRSAYKTRMESLVKQGKIGRKYADEKLVPQIEAFAMSLDDVNEDYTFAKNHLEMALDILEENESLVGELKNQTEPAGAEVPSEPGDMGDGTELSLADATAILDELNL